MKHKCKKCGKTAKLIVKMGGLICGNCRIIVYAAGSDEHSKAIKAGK